MAQFEYDVVIVGASFGGVSAAAAAADPKVRVVLLESSSWAGGQATAQGVTRWDEAAAALTEANGSTKSYRDLRDAIRSWYRGNTTLSDDGNRQLYFNPGFARVGPPFAAGGTPFGADPHVTREILDGMLAAAQPRLHVNYGVTVTAVTVQGDAVQGITVESDSGTDTYRGKVYIDATDMGDLLPLAGITWTIGAESFADTHETDAPAQAHPEWIQPITVPIALERRPDGENHRIAKPANYDEIRRPQNQDFRVVDGDIGGVFTIEPGFGETLWSYRRYIDARNFDDADVAFDRSTMNIASNDYQARAIPTGSAADDAAIVEDARAVSIAFVYWLQTDCPHDPHGPDPTGKGYPNLMIRADAFGRDDGTAPAAYIRESRRIDAEERVVRQDIELGNRPKGTVRGARLFRDSCGIGWYGIDVHPAKGPGTRQHNFSTLPFQIPLGALLPKTLTNFVAGCKNIGTTHLTSGAYRVHPVEWAIGEAAGVLAAYCTTQGVSPKDTWHDPNRVLALQRRLLARGVPIFWWADVPLEPDARTFAAIHECGVRSIFVGDSTLNFNPDADFPQSAHAVIDQRVGRNLPWAASPQPMTRAQAAVWICEQLGFPL